MDADDFMVAAARVIRGQADCIDRLRAKLLEREEKINEMADQITRLLIVVETRRLIDDGLIEDDLVEDGFW